MHFANDGVTAFGFTLCIDGFVFAAGVRPSRRGHFISDAKVQRRKFKIVRSVRNPKRCQPQKPSPLGHRAIT